MRLAALVAGGVAIFFLCVLPLAAEELWPVLSPEFWSFSGGAEFPGATGSLAAGRDGSLLLKGDFSGGGNYVAARSAMLDFPKFREIRFRLRTNAGQLALRCRDSAGQTHQIVSQKLSGNAGEWQEAAFRADLPSRHHWGGPNDGTIYFPIRHVSLLLQKDRLRDACGSVEIRDLGFSGTVPGARIPLLLKNPQPDSCFVSPGTTAPLRLVMLCGPERPGPELGFYRYCDYTGKTVAEGSAPFDPAGRAYSVPLPQKPGFYELELPGFGKSHGILVCEPHAGKPDDYFGIDEPSTWKSEELMRRMVRINVRSGIVRRRDRIRWGELNPERGRFDFNAGKGRYEMAHRVTAEMGMKVLNATHETPKWNKRLASEKDDFRAGINTGRYSYGSNVFPRDLIAAADSVSGIVRHWPVIDAFEVWNEPDILFGNNFPPEFVTALTKAVSRRFADDRVTAKILGGCFATPTRKQMYRTYLANGLLDDCDILSYHTYHRADEEERKVLRMRREELEYAPRRAGIPYWITESGMPWSAGGPRPERNEDRFSASEIVAKAIEYKALGIKAYFPFKDTFYRESKSNFGMYGEDLTPLRSMAAYAHLPGTLAHKRYIGDLKLPGAVRSRVFSDGRETVACIYVPLDVKANMGRRRDLAPPEPLPVPAGLPVRRVEGIDGRALSLKDGLLPVEDGVVFLFLDGEPERFLNRETDAMRVYRLAENYRPAPRAAKPAVIQPDYELTGLTYDREGYLVTAGEQMELKVIFNNLSDRKLAVRPEFQPVEGVRAVTFDTGELTLEPGARREYAFTVAFDNTLSGETYSTFRLADANGNATPMAVAVKRSAKSEVVLPVAAKGTGWIRVAPKEWRAWAGAKPDIDAKFRLSWSPERLRLEVSVRDPEHSCDFDANQAWRGDSIQFGLQARDGKTPAPRLKFYNFCAASCAGGDTVYRDEPANVCKESLRGKIAFRFSRNGSDSVYTLEIPADEIGLERFEAEQRLGFALLVNSGSPGRRNGYLTWGDGIGDGKFPALYNDLKLTEAE